MATPPPPPPAPVVYDLDDDTHFNQCFAKLKNPATENFVVRFDGAESKCSVDIDTDAALTWLQSANRPPGQALWLNCWASQSQRPLIAAVAKKYDLSPRLTGLLGPNRTSSGQPASEPAAAASSSSQSGSTDVEKGAAAPSAGPSPTARPPSSLKGINFGDVVNDLWHFCSVDFGRHYIYVGFNALFSLPSTGDTDGGSGSGSGSKPSGQRIWTSLLICDDGTVISVFERPTKPEGHAAARRNVLNVFRHLSRQHDKDDRLDALMKVGVRWNDRSATSGAGYSPNEAASLLFYYLFDDWLSTYALIARREHPYRDTLEQLRQLMFQAADVTLIQQVHDVGRQLTVLKLMYQSYELIVSRLLYRQRSRAGRGPAAGTPPPLAPDVRLYHDTAATPGGPGDHVFLDDESPVSVKLEWSAVVRFERLLDRIRLYALTEIEECLKEKESLVLMNFNLVALKESQAVERLTRTTILLAKATILFLPVSLMTGYFSIQVPEVSKIYSLETYWLCFLVVTAVSILFLLVFGITTHTVEGRTIYRSLTRMVLDKGKRKRQ